MSLLIAAHDPVTTYWMELAMNKLLQEPRPDVVACDPETLPIGEPDPIRPVQLIIVDLRSIDDPSRVIAHFVQCFPKAKMLGVIRPNSDESQSMALALKSEYGAPHGIVPSSVSPELLVAAVRILAEGGNITLGGAERASGMGAAIQDSRSSTPSTYSRNSASARYQLTVREEEVLTFLQTGMPNKAIAARMGLSANTIRVHIQNVLRKLDAKNRTEAANKAQHANGFRLT